ncbi:hypothetical protein XENOCAPTIV_000627 [Xenoophorus captivus]|uniref:Uncharacterized protein n=1 Tax=Xenoophorus captivus TaxID=1517983 RepID=A0ABV0Q7Y9_9TELE
MGPCVWQLKLGPNRVINRTMTPNTASGQQQLESSTRPADRSPLGVQNKAVQNSHAVQGWFIDEASNSSRGRGPFKSVTDSSGLCAVLIGSRDPFAPVFLLTRTLFPLISVCWLSFTLNF